MRTFRDKEAQHSPRATKNGLLVVFFFIDLIELANFAFVFPSILLEV
jgi:hypothetical protein